MVKRSWLRLALPVLFVGAIAMACDDDEGNGPTGPTIDDLVGTWAATSAVVTLNADPSVQVDAVQTLGATITLTVNADETFTLVADLPGTPPDTFTGDFTVSGNNVTLTTDDDPDNPLSGTFSLSADGNTLDVNVDDVELFDLTQDGEVTTADAANLDATFARQ